MLGATAVEEEIRRCAKYYERREERSQRQRERIHTKRDREKTRQVNQVIDQNRKKNRTKKTGKGHFEERKSVTK